MKRTLIVGYGFLGRQVADLADLAGDRVWATTRNAQKMRQMSGGPIQPLHLDWTDRRTLRGLPEVDRVLVSVSYDSRSPHSRYDSQVGGLRNLLQVLPPSTDVCYISTTGVYHQTDGRWVDETSPCHPNRMGGRVHLQAESLLHRMRPDSPWSVLRFSGIYGPGRVPRSADVIAGRPIALPSNGYLNLIHVTDGARAVVQNWDRHSGGLDRRRMYLISDDQPMHRSDFYRQIARQVGAAEPSFSTSPPAGASDRMRSDSDKRIWNRRMKSDLVSRLAFPTYREGLAAVL
ncbi:NAD dependent epimerase/dehydratase family protein [Rubripirellula lacrimiformis]|uniref:NAD dependent epimerase/dehydratase family protein n=1 Tax=Rubripirellula lacrimiformis TaxID=1930273 RepID=A0A517N9A1_9BACT|nr:NAD-dependent epimerase/dehydratase family protein [Rubripirellula lacrimiformis]QDT03715.1 NAD dependent epimerase/dehydratase family protein [Rubripirellula lacrimiformis]